MSDMKRIARRLLRLERRQDATRTPQLPHMSIEFDDGTERQLIDGVTAGVDAATDLEGVSDHIEDLDDLTDVGTELDADFLPRLEGIGEGQDVSFETALLAAERVEEARVELEETRTDLDERITDAEATVSGMEGRLTETEQRADAAFGASKAGVALLGELFPNPAFVYGEDGLEGWAGTGGRVRSPQGTPLLVVAGHEVVDVLRGGDADCYDEAYVEP